MAVKKYHFHLFLSSQEFLPYYQGHVTDIQVITTQGIKVQFPAMHMRPFITSMGIKGYFCLTTENNRFKSLEKITP